MTARTISRSSCASRPEKRGTTQSCASKRQETPRGTSKKRVRRVVYKRVPWDPKVRRRSRSYQVKWTQSWTDRLPAASSETTELGRDVSCQKRHLRCEWYVKLAIQYTHTSLASYTSCAVAYAFALLLYDLKKINPRWKKDCNFYKSAQRMYVLHLKNLFLWSLISFSHSHFFIGFAHEMIKVLLLSCQVLYSESSNFEWTLVMCHCLKF